MRRRDAGRALQARGATAFEWQLIRGRYNMRFRAGVLFDNRLLTYTLRVVSDMFFELFSY
jgi:hypothetical protein